MSNDKTTEQPIPQDTKEFAAIKSALGQIFWDFIAMSADGKAIEGNPAVHRMAQWVYEKLHFLPLTPAPEVKEEKKGKHERLMDILNGPTPAETVHPSEQPAHVPDIKDILWDELAREYDDLNRMEENSWEWNRNILKQQYTIVRNTQGAVPDPKGEIPEEMMREISAAYASLPTVKQMGMGEKGWRGGSCYMYRKTRQEVAIYMEVLEAAKTTTDALRAQNTTLTKSLEERDQALVVFRKEIVCLHEENETLIASAEAWEGKYHRAEENIQRLIDDLAAKSDEAGDYRKALQKETYEWIHGVTYETHEESVILLAKYPNP